MTVPRKRTGDLGELQISAGRHSTDTVLLSQFTQQSKNQNGGQFGGTTRTEDSISFHCACLKSQEDTYFIFRLTADVDLIRLGVDASLMQLLEPISAILAATHSCSCPAELGPDQHDAQSHATLALICTNATTLSTYTCCHEDSGCRLCMLSPKRQSIDDSTTAHVRTHTADRCSSLHACKHAATMRAGLVCKNDHQINQSSNHLHPQDSLTHTKQSPTLPCATTDQQHVLLHMLHNIQNIMMCC